MGWIVIILFFIGGTQRWPWWTAPLAGAVVGPVIAFSGEAWRVQVLGADAAAATLVPRLLIAAASAAVTSALAYWLGRGARIAYERLAAKPPST
jgi:hypothetical protein